MIFVIMLTDNLSCRGGFKNPLIFWAPIGRDVSRVVLDWAVIGRKCALSTGRWGLVKKKLWVLNCMSVTQTCNIVSQGEKKFSLGLDKQGI